MKTYATSAYRLVAAAILLTLCQPAFADSTPPTTDATATSPTQDATQSATSGVIRLSGDAARGIVVSAGYAEPGFMVPVYNEFRIEPWLRVKGAPHTPGDARIDKGLSITMGNPLGLFEPSKTKIIVTTEPIVTRLSDGTWEIAFPKK